MIIAGPEDLESLALLEEVKHLETELKNSDLKLEVLKQPGREELTQTLEQGKYKIFHYAGHSNLGDAGGDLYLVNRKTGLTETMPGYDLVGLLRNNGIQLAVFNSCRSTDTVLEDSSLSSQHSLTQALIKHEIPAVLAMAEQIPDEVALTLFRLFYRNLNLGYPIDLSLSRARQGLISTYGSKQFYWALPVLYLHPDFDGILLRKKKEEQSFSREFLSPEEEEFLPFPNRGEEEERVDFVPSAYLHDQGLESDFSEAEDGAEAFIREVFADFTNEEASLALEPPGEVVAVENDRDHLGDETAENHQVESPEDWQRRWQILPKKPLLVTAITIAIAFMTILLSNIEQTQRVSQVQVTEEFPETGISPNVETETLFNIILAEIRTGNLERALEGIEVLLERGAIPYAENALNTIPIDATNNAEVMFLKGRSAWEYYLQGHQNYPEPDDARRFWELAVESEPRLDYVTALGFAYYEEGQYSRAIDTWYDAIRIVSAEETENPQTRTIYAGLALGLQQLAEETQGRQGEIARAQGVKMYNTVMKQDPLKFRPESLSQEWLWSEKAIIDWEKF